MFKTAKTLIIIMLAGIILAACSSQPTGSPAPLPGQGDNPYAPQPGDAAMMEDKVEVVSVSVLMAESFPPQISVSLAYRLTTPCNSLRVILNPADSAHRILLNVYGVAPKDKPCSMMVLATPLQASISLGSYSSGQYTVWINGVQVGEFKI
jgi:hypothetical protein